jgi:hypothetical protein
MNFVTSSTLLLVLGLVALLVGIASWRIAPNWGRTPASAAPLPQPVDPPPAEQSGAKNLFGPRSAISEILSVRADGRSSYLFNGRADLFCPLSISEVEACLPKPLFFRCHRSYIVNLAHVSSVKEVADAGVVELDSPLRRAAPISHGRVAALRAELAAFRSSAMPREDMSGKRAASGDEGMAAP